MKNERKIHIDARELGGLGDVLKHIIGDIVSDLEDNQAKIPIGIISEELRNEFFKWRESKEELELEIELQMRLAQKRVEREMKERFETKFDAINERKKEFWNMVHKELGIFTDANLNIDPKTGVISQWVETHGKTN